MTFTLKPHEYVKKRGGSFLKVNPYVRFRAGDDTPPIFIQGGNYYYEDGEKIEPKDVPESIKAQVNKLTDQAKKECGLIK
jgi:hypothetical protein